MSGRPAERGQISRAVGGRLWATERRQAPKVAWDLGWISLSVPMSPGRRMRSVCVHGYVLGHASTVEEEAQGGCQAASRREEALAERRVTTVGGD